jgi:diguanylate cyclase (GGDEF)-like protein
MMNYVEQDRLLALHSLGILDTVSEERFDRYTRLAQRIFDVPIALVSLVDSNRQWFKSCQGLDVSETDRASSFCSHAIRKDEVMIVRDTMKDDRFIENSLVTGDPNIRFYAGCPIKGPSGHALGTFCIIDKVPRELSGEDITSLKDLAALVERELVMLQESTTDLLTGLSNRRGFTLIAQQLLSASLQRGINAVMVFIDIDDFKSINDTFGHKAGDRALEETAVLLRRSFRSIDLIGRIGGDEFAILCLDTAAGEAIIGRLKKTLKIRNNRIIPPWKIKFSVGTVQFNSSHHAGVEDLLAEADRAMYAIKKMRVIPNTRRVRMAPPVLDGAAGPFISVKGS